MSVRVDIKGQFVVDNPFSGCKNTEKVTIDHTLVASSVPRNWSLFCTDANKSLEEVTRAKVLHRGLGPVSLIGLVTFFVALNLFFGAASFLLDDVLLIGLGIAGLLTYFAITIATRQKIQSGMNSLKAVCQNHSGNGVRYVLCDERMPGFCSRQQTKCYFVTVMNHDVEEQAVAHATNTDVALGSTLNNNPTPLVTASASTYAPQPSAPSTNPYLQAAPAPTPAPSTGNSIFDQLSK